MKETHANLDLPTKKFLGNGAGSVVGTEVLSRSTNFHNLSNTNSAGHNPNDLNGKEFKMSKVLETEQCAHPVLCTWLLPKPVTTRS